MKKLFLLASIVTVMAFNVYADGPAATGEGDTDCSRIVQSTGEATGTTATSTGTTTPTVINR